MANSKTVIAFDLYGTLLSTESIAEGLAKTFGQDAAKPIAALWRRYQLEYTWRINSMGSTVFLCSSSMSQLSSRWTDRVVSRLVPYL